MLEGQREGSRTFILGIARERRPSRVIGRVAATALGGVSDATWFRGGGRFGTLLVHFAARPLMMTMLSLGGGPGEFVPSEFVKLTTWEEAFL